MTDMKQLEALLLAEEYRSSMQHEVLHSWAKDAVTELRRLHAENIALRAERDELRTEIEGLKAARIAYASEFPLNADGEPDVGNIHANIRALKRQLVKESEAWMNTAAPHPAPVAQGDALIDFIESAGSVHIHRVRVGINRPIRWDVEYGYEDAKVSGRTLRDAISGALKAGAASTAKEGQSHE